MRSKIIICVICALMITVMLMIEVPNAASAQFTEEWAVRYSGSANAGDLSYDMAIGPEGNLYVTGYSTDILTGIAATTIAYDPNGSEIWTARYQDPDIMGSMAKAIAIDNTGNIYVTGSSRSRIEDTHLDYITIAYDSLGNQRWIASYNGPVNYADFASAITTDQFGNIYITGASMGNPWGEDFTTIKYDSFGNEKWVARYSGPGSHKDEAQAITVDNAGNVYVTGGSYMTGTGMDYLTIKYDSFGNEVWITRYSFKNWGEERAYAIVLDILGNIYVTGTLGSVAYDQNGSILWTIDDAHGYDMIISPLGDIIVTGWSPDVMGNDDFFSAAYDSNGSVLWRRSYNGPGNSWDRAYTIEIDSLGNTYVAGGSTNTDMYMDCTLIAYDSFGNELWVARYDGLKNLHGRIYAMVIDTSGNIYTTGICWGSEMASDWITIKYSEVQPNLEWNIDIDPNTLNLKSKGRWITCYITLNEPYDVNDIDISTILLEDTITAEWGDVQGTTLMVKFDRSEVEDMLSPGTYNLKVTGELTDGTSFEGYSDEIRVIDPGK